MVEQIKIALFSKRVSREERERRKRLIDDTFEDFSWIVTTRHHRAREDASEEELRRLLSVYGHH